MEHIPRAPAVYEVAPLDYQQAKQWLEQANFVSMVRTTEMIAAIKSGMGITLMQSAMPVSLRPGDEALLITLSFSVLLAWAEEKISPLPEDWRCVALTMKARGESAATGNMLAVAEDLLAHEPA